MINTSIIAFCSVLSLAVAFFVFVYFVIGYVVSNIIIIIMVILGTMYYNIMHIYICVAHKLFMYQIVIIITITFANITSNYYYTLIRAKAIIKCGDRTSICFTVSYLSCFLVVF